MSPLLSLYLDQFLIFVLVLTRIGALLMTMPVLGTATVPLQVRALLAVGISLVLTPLFWGQPIPAPENLMILGTLLAREAMLVVPGVELLDSRERVRLFGTVDQRHRGSQRALGVIGKEHVDILQDVA